MEVIRTEKCGVAEGENKDEPETVDSWATCVHIAAAKWSKESGMGQKENRRADSGRKVRADRGLANLPRMGTERRRGRGMEKGRIHIDKKKKKKKKKKKWELQKQKHSKKNRGK